ncbi:MAG: alkyl hydroperoxide reductase subunit F [Pseudomonadota bacterium]|nr:alkyl hydroperoxide reductase subunit F [Pseudomonadota bacterium]
MLDQNLKQQLQGLLGQIPGRVELQLTLDGSDESRQLDELAHEIAALSDKVALADKVALGSAPGKAARAPALEIVAPERGTRIGFAGVPLGHEFTSLVLALLHSGGHPPKLESDTQQQIANLDGEYNFEIYVSLSCQTCPDVVQALNTLAALNPRVRTTMIDGALFQPEIEAKNILAVPTVYLNGQRFSQGRIGINDILRKLAGNGAGDKALNNRAPYDMLIVGGGPAGASAAIYAARKGLRTGIVAENFGGQVLDTLGIENFISVKATEGPKLVASLEEHVRSYAVDIMQGQRAREVTAKGADGLFRVHLESGATLRARSVVLATGARWRQVNVPGESEYKGNGVAYCPHCDGPLFKGKKVAVIGGGNSGIEAAIDLAGIVEHVTVLEYSSVLKADKVLVDKARSLANVTIVTDAQTTAIDGDGARVTGLRYRDRNTGTEHEVALAGVFVQIGLVPNSDPVKGLVELSPFGEVVTNRKGESSVSGIFAAGDVSDTAFKQIIIAMGDGATAALGAFDYLIRNSNADVTDKAA